MASVGGGGGGAGEGNLLVAVEPVQGPTGEDPALMLPEEIWCKIFEYLKEDLRDMLNISATCSLFHDIVQREEDLPGRRLEEVVPLLLRWLDRADILTCRGITKRVRKAVDKVLSNAALVCPFENLNLFPRLIRPSSAPASIQDYEQRHFWDVPTIETGVIDSVERIERLARDFEQGQIATLVANHLSFVFLWTGGETPVLVPADILDKTLTFLKVITDQVEQLGLFVAPVNNANDDPIFMYDMIQRCVSELPKLRLLHCGNLTELSTGLESGAPILERYIANGHPLPGVPLEKLRIDGIPLPVPLFREILCQYSDHLKDAEIELWQNISEEDLLGWEEEYQLPALRILKLDDFTWPWHPILCKMRAEKLKYLYWTVLCSPRPAPASPVTLLIQVIQRFPSLSILDLDVKLNGYADFAESYRVPLGELNGVRHYNLQILHLKGYWYNIPLWSFARIFPNLKSIKIDGISWNMVLDRGRRTDPDLELCFWRRFHESTVWDLLPGLDEFQICPCDGSEKYLCSRADVFQFQNQQDLRVGCNEVWV